MGGEVCRPDLCSRRRTRRKAVLEQSYCSFKSKMTIFLCFIYLLVFYFLYRKCPLSLFIFINLFIFILFIILFIFMEKCQLYFSYFLVLFYYLFDLFLWGNAYLMYFIRRPLADMNDSFSFCVLSQ